MMAGPGDERDDHEDYDGTDNMAETPTYDDTEELSLTDQDEPLPWLESSEYDDGDNANNAARWAGFSLLALVILGLLVGGIWFLTNRASDSEQVADGSLIEAPEGEYRTAPDDAGGTEVEGTDQTSFAVGEGERREGRIANREAARPSVNTRSTDEEETASEATPTPAATDGVGVQVGAYSTRASADAGWQTLQRQTDALNGVKHRVVEGQADIGTVFRLQAVAGDRAAANRLCAALKADGVACQVKR